MDIKIFHLEWTPSKPEESDALFMAKLGNEEAIQSFWAQQGKYAHVATLLLPDGISQTDALEKSFELSNTIEHNWSRNRGIKMMPDFAAGARSSSVGDVFQIGDEAFAVMSFGFEPIGAPARRQITCCIEEGARKEFGMVERSGWTVWDTTVNPPGCDVVDCFPPEWERKEVEDELAKRGFTISPEDKAVQHRLKM